MKKKQLSSHLYDCIIIHYLGLVLDTTVSNGDGFCCVVFREKGFKLY